MSSTLERPVDAATCCKCDGRFFYLAMCDFRRYYMAVFGTNGKRKGLREKGKFEYDTCIKRVSVIRRFCMSGWSASHSAPGAQLDGSE